MRLLHLGKYYAPERGGIERSTQDLAEGCIARGDAVGVLVHQRGGTWRSTRESIGGVRVHRVGCIAAPVYTPLSPAYPLALAGALREIRPDLLHLHMPNPSCLAVLLSPAARRIPWVVHWHADIPPDTPDWRLRHAYRLYRPFEQRLLARAAAIIVTSQAYLDTSQALAPWRNKATVIPLGVGDASPVSPNPSAWPSSSGLRLLAVGRLSRYKGLHVLIEAMAKTPDASLLLVGSGECAAELDAQIDRLALGARVRRTGTMSDADLASAYVGADALVLPSLDRGEAFGMVLLEAMRASLPVIASDVPGSGIASVVADGETGLRVAPGDVAALVRAIEHLRDAALRRRYGVAGRMRYEERFTDTAMIAATRALYARVLGAMGGVTSAATSD